MERIITFIKKEVVLSICIVLAVVSMFFVPPDEEYRTYIDVRTLLILFSLMGVTGGLKNQGIFDGISSFILKKMRSTRGIIMLLWILCFFFAMFVTNDVALITFVPLSVIILAENETALAWAVALQTVAANLGSMLTPIGNPQNLYLFGLSGYSVGQFVSIVFPYAAVSFMGLVLACLVMTGREHATVNALPDDSGIHPNKRVSLLLAGLFVLSVLTVGHIVPAPISALAVFISLLIFDREALYGIDYSLLFTFAALFIFIGNTARIGAVSEFMSAHFEGNEIVMSILLCQVISNVPAAILLSGFTDRIDLLIIGTDIGGLGTLIASMASLISYKLLTQRHKHLRVKYFSIFTFLNLLFLGICILTWMFV